MDVGLPSFRNVLEQWLTGKPAKKLFRMHEKFWRRMMAHNPRRKVIVRAWGDEPVCLYLYAIKISHCYVGKESCKHPIGIRVQDVFQWDEYVWPRLVEAYQADDKPALESIYRTLASFE